MTFEELMRRYDAGERPTIPDEHRARFEEEMAKDEKARQLFGPREDSPPDIREWRPPELPPRFKVEGELGRGGMGIVYLAHDCKLDRRVAVKLINPGEMTFGPLIQRFLREARTLAQLDHPNIVRIYECADTDDGPYYAMEYIEGKSLEQRIEEGPIPPTQAVQLLRQAAEGVAHAHSSGIIHRDLKPANILVDPKGRACVTDFGLARDVKNSTKRTTQGWLVGTPAYMAPEQAEGRTQDIGERTDVYALGVILYEMLTGKVPFPGDSPVKTLHDILEKEVVPPSLLCRGIPMDLEAICLKAMARDPEARYTTMAAFAEELRRYQRGKTIVARKPGWPRRVWRLCRRHARMTIGAAIVLAFSLIWRALAREEAQQARLEREARETSMRIDLQRAEAVEAHRRALAEQEKERKREEAEAAERREREAVRTEIDAACKLCEAGKPSESLKAFEATLKKANGEERRQIADLLLNVAVGLADLDQRVEAWRVILSIEPEKSFGPLDGDFARSLVGDLQRRYENLNDAATKEPEKAREAASRLRVFLLGDTGTKRERDEARGTFTVLQENLTLQGKAVPPLPQGEEPSASQQSPPAAVDAWQQAQDALNEGERLEQAGKKEEALSKYEQAYEGMRRQAPVYEAPHRALSMSDSTPVMRWTNETDDGPTLRQAEEAVRRLGGGKESRLTGGITLHLEGMDQAKGWVPGVQLMLYDAEHAEGGRFAAVSFQGDGVAKVGVADGKYALKVLMEGDADGLDPERQEASRYTIDASAVPATVTVKGDWQDLKPLRVHALTKIDVTGPEAGKGVDLRSGVFEWKPVPGAVRYRVKMHTEIKTAVGNEHSTEFVDVDAEVTVPRLCWGQAGMNVDEDKGGRLNGSLEAFIQDRGASWCVDALDAQGARIATSGPRRPFVVQHGVGDK